MYEYFSRVLYLYLWAVPWRNGLWSQWWPGLCPGETVPLSDTWQNRCDLRVCLSPASCTKRHPHLGDETKVCEIHYKNEIWFSSCLCHQMKTPSLSCVKLNYYDTLMPPAENEEMPNLFIFHFLGGFLCIIKYLGAPQRELSAPICWSLNF